MYCFTNLCAITRLKKKKTEDQDLNKRQCSLNICQKLSTQSTTDSSLVES